MTLDVIHSPHNQQIKRLASLLSRKGRTESGRYLVEGVHLVEEALKSEAEVTTVVYDAERGIPEEIASMLAGRPDVALLPVSSSIFHKLSETKSPQGILAEVGKRQLDWKMWWNGQRNHDRLLLLLDEIQDPGNLGTILRTAEAAGVDAVVVGRGSVDLYNGKVVRATMGALFRLAVFVEDLVPLMDEIAQAGGNLLVTSLEEASQPYDAPLYAGHVAIVIGNEGRGVSPHVRERATDYVHIPLYGKAESLNAAVAAGIMLYEARRQQKKRV
ncbi:RNA methyltransferase [Brevibacillus humidisoli]|uniref:TrmH family RNA methyltransferase n=1 Tax=Brevibacillus humidisoli TaxID=2895522 RepID=UPI001E539F44|nr:RNA methyltransferase [Brevibacillus humidisoli]UFJ39186.1 RNA methyltransferase [Brevibacillus humidisoli]